MTLEVVWKGVKRNLECNLKNDAIDFTFVEDWRMFIHSFGWHKLFFVFEKNN
jgi:hypothetical protein